MKQIRIYQLPVEHKAKFMGLDFVKENGIMPELKDYKVVYEGEFEPQGEYSEPDQLYMKFQGEKPEGYTGHSISMSDVVEIDGEYFYCDSIGWEKITFTSIKEEEAKRYGTTAESLEEQGFIFMEEACGDCHWFAPCAEFGGTLMSLAWYREQQKNFRNEHFKKDEEAKMIDIEENGNRCAGETPEMEARIAEARRMKRYQELKSKHLDAMLLFRCGDFYETYYGDAIAAAKVLGITLRHRQGFGKGHEIAGFPHHALDIYLPKLIRAGLRVAIVDE